MISLDTVRRGETVEIPLAKGGFALVSAEDCDLVSHFHWYRTRFGYAMARVEGPVFIWMHRLIVGAVSGEDVDHIDRDRLNNTRQNLRKCSRAQNLWNSVRHKDSTSPYKGVTFIKNENKWKARIMAYGKVHELGRFNSPEEARDARAAAAVILHGEFARAEGSHAS